MLISESLKITLYPLGIISTCIFTIRFLLQWYQSEKEGKSVVYPSFWKISLVGNAMLGIHSFIQGQYPICLVQSLNGMIALRNLNLMKKSNSIWSFKSTCFFLLLSSVAPTALFYFFSSDVWLRIPLHRFQINFIPLSQGWHLIGYLGVILFASRFWIQWLEAEKNHKSRLSLPFWWLSLIGALFSFIYFLKIQDYVNLLGPLFGMIPYMRNLFLLYRHSYVQAGLKENG